MVMSLFPEETIQQARQHVGEDHRHEHQRPDHHEGCEDFNNRACNLFHSPDGRSRCK